MEPNRDDWIGDAFRNGLLYSEIYQRIYGNNTLNLEDTISQSRSTWKHSEVFTSSRSVWNITFMKEPVLMTATQKCYILASIKLQIVCPARDDGEMKVCMRITNTKSKFTLAATSILASTNPSFLYSVHKSPMKAKINNITANFLIDTGSTDIFWTTFLQYIIILRICLAKVKCRWQYYFSFVWP